MTRGPVLIDLDGVPEAAPDRAPPLPEAAPEGQAMRAAMAGMARRPSLLGRAFWGLALALLGAAVSVAAWDFAMGLLARAPLLGWAVAAIGAALLVVALLIGLREAAGFARLGRLDALRARAGAAHEAGDLEAARAVLARLRALYRGRAEAARGLARLDARAGDAFDADALLALAEAELLAPLDAAALREVEGAARQVAAITALVPLALADVVGALVVNLRMIRAVATIYGGRTGTLGNWRLARAVMAHLVATGAVAVGDDLIGSVAGGGLVSRLSRRFGEGVVNGALTARVGLAAIELCRPLPRIAAPAPSVGGVVRRALTGLFSRGDAGQG
ncbi:MAG: TIGR01620 family protein [Roseovarius sp.]|jgi:putative membrane protein|nr:TIGR01620 family protein [Roseovarius sp.]